MPVGFQVDRQIRVQFYVVQTRKNVETFETDESESESCIVVNGEDSDDCILVEVEPGE